MVGFWQTCKRCTLHQHRHKVVFGRGVIPAQMLMIGEAPGKGENARGEAFVGPAGRMLNTATKQVAAVTHKQPSFYVTNVVACRPCDVRSGPNREPTLVEALACRPRLSRTVVLAQPQRVIFLGDVAERYAGCVCPDGVKLRHPAYLLRRGGVEAPEYRTFVQELSEIYESIK